MTKNTGVKETLHISRKLTQNGFRAFDYAIATGVPFNIYAVLNLRESAAAGAQTLLRRILHKYRDWWAYKRQTDLSSIAPSYLTTVENPGGTNSHVNWVLHLPPSYHAEFRRKVLSWWEKAHGRAPQPFDVDVQDVDPGTEKRLAKYCFKGADPDYIDHFHLRELYDQHGPQGPVYGQRAIISRSLGRSARDATGWKPRRRRVLPTSLMDAV